MGEHPRWPDGSPVLIGQEVDWGVEGGGPSVVRRIVGADRIGVSQPDGDVILNVPPSQLRRPPAAPEAPLEGDRLQRQDSLTDQLADLHRLGVAHGLYDAVDHLNRVAAGAGQRGTDRLREALVGNEKADAALRRLAAFCDDQAAVKVYGDDTRSAYAAIAAYLLAVADSPQEPSNGGAP